MLPDYIAKASPNPPSNRAPWYVNTAPSYAGIFLWIAFYNDIAKGTITQASLLSCMVAIAIAGFLCYLLYYRVPAMLGMQTGFPLYVVGSSTFGTTGGYLMPGLLMGLLQIGWFAVGTFFATQFISMAAFFAVAYFLIFPADLIPSILAGALGFFFPRIMVGRRISKRLIAFENQLADTLSLWVNALRSGYSVPQAMEAIGRDSPDPTRSEFRRVVQEMQLGISVTDALNHMLERVESEDLDLVVTAVNIQREVGGNLSEILEVIGNVVRERIKLKGEIRVMTSQGRYTGYLISGLPIVLAIFLRVINPGYMNQMFEDRACGWPMVGIGLALIGMGSALIQKIVDIDI